LFKKCKIVTGRLKIAKVGTREKQAKMEIVKAIILFEEKKV